MKTWHLFFVGAMALVSAAELQAQIVIPIPAPQVVTPTTPTAFTTRNTGASLNVEGTAAEPVKQEPTVRMITHFTVSPSRQWKSTDGKTLVGSLIAFEDDIVITQGRPPANPPPPTLPAKPTIVRAGKARLLVNGRPYEVPLSRLSEEDQKLIESIRAASPGAQP